MAARHPGPGPGPVQVQVCVCVCVRVGVCVYACVLVRASRSGCLEYLLDGIESANQLA